MLKLNMLTLFQNLNLYKMETSFNLSLEEAQKLFASYRAEIENQRKNLDAVVSLAFLLEKHIDSLIRQSIENEQGTSY